MSKGKRNSRAREVAPVIRFTSPVRIACGWASAVISGGRIVSIRCERTKALLMADMAGMYPGAKEIAADRVAPGKTLRAYSEGKAVSPREVASLPVAWDAVTAFSANVLKETAAIPYGSTATYGEIAAGTGNPAASRAVGAALSRNPWPILVPCHRVVGKGGRLVGFAKGLDAKEALLAFEKRNSGAGGVAHKKGKTFNP